MGTHLNPDGDALGCALAMGEFLEQRGIPHEIVCHHAPPSNLGFLPKAWKIIKEPKEKHSLGIILDLDSLERLGSLEPEFEECERIIVIDHHIPHTAPGQLRIEDTTAAATAVILTELFLQIGAEITPTMATCLLTGIITDTGCFRFRNTDARALHLAAKLLELGADISTINEEIFQRKPVAAVRLLGIAFENMQMCCDDRLCWSWVTHEDFTESGGSDENTEGFVNELLSIQTVDIAMIARETRENRVRVSLRSRSGFDVAEVARAFGGGGHKNAAGCSFDEPVETALEKLLPKVRECLASS